VQKGLKTSKQWLIRRTSSLQRSDPLLLRLGGSSGSSSVCPYFWPGTTAGFVHCLSLCCFLSCCLNYEM